MKRFDLEERMKGFALEIVRLTGPLLARVETRMIGDQLLRSGTAVGSIYREAGRAESRRDFIHKLSLCLKEADESAYWLDLLTESGLCNTSSSQRLRAEADELLRILAASLRTAKTKR